MSGSIFIRGGTLVTVDKTRRILKDGGLLVENGMIAAVDKAEKLRDARVEFRIDATNMVVTPGLIDAHVHVTTEHLVRGFVPDDSPLMRWRSRWILPLYSATTPEEEYICAKMAFTEFLKTGTTCFSEAGTAKSVGSVVRAMEEMGIRGTVGRWTWDLPPQPKNYANTCAEGLRGIEETIREFHGKAEGRVSAWACVVGSNTCSDELLLGAKQLADKYRTGMHMHQSNVWEQVDDFVKRIGKRPMEHFSEIGLLGPNLLMSHMIYLSEAEFDIIKKHDAKLVFCPTSANKLGFGALKNGHVPEAIERGICVALGGDGATCSDMFDMLRIMHVMAGSWKDARADPSKTSAEKVLEMATIDGARALGLERQIGSLEVGKKADIALFARSTPEWNPVFNVVNSLVYSASGGSVDTVIVDGRILMRKRAIEGLDEPALYRQVQNAGERLVERTGLKLETRWPVS